VWESVTSAHPSQTATFRWSPLVTCRSTGFACSGGGGGSTYRKTSEATLLWRPRTSEIDAVMVLSPAASRTVRRSIAFRWQSSSVHQKVRERMVAVPGLTWAVPWLRASSPE
jgi:hypothetical protein